MTEPGKIFYTCCSLLQQLPLSETMIYYLLPPSPVGGGLRSLQEEEEGLNKRPGGKDLILAGMLPLCL